MGGMSLTTINFIIKLTIFIWILTLTRSIAIMFCGKLFEKASKGAKTASYPIINLFGMLEVVDLSSFLGILLFMPGLNLIVLFLMSYKLGKVFNVSTGKRIGLIFLSLIFYPIVAKDNVKYKSSNDEYLMALDSAKSESVHLLTQDEISQFNTIEEPVVEVVDSIFKSELEQIITPEPYKAKRINENIMKSDSSFDNLFDSVDNINKFEMKQEQKEPEKKIETIELVNDVFRPVEKTGNNEVVINSFGPASNIEQSLYTPFATTNEQPVLIIEDEVKPNYFEQTSLFKPIEDENGFSTIGEVKTTPNKFNIDLPEIDETFDVGNPEVENKIEEIEIFEDLTPSNEIKESNINVDSLFKPVEENNSFSSIEKINNKTEQNKFITEIPEEQNIFAPIEKIVEFDSPNVEAEPVKNTNKFVLDFEEPTELEILDL